MGAFRSTARGILLPLTSLAHLSWLLAVLVLPAGSSSSKTLFVCPCPSSYSYIHDTSLTQRILIRLEQLDARAKQ